MFKMQPPGKDHRVNTWIIISLVIGIIFLSCINEPFFKSLYDRISIMLGVADLEFTIFLADRPDIGHAFLYGLLTFILLCTLKMHFSIALALLLGAGLEGIQILIPSRQGLLSDFIADLAGIAAATMLFGFVKVVKQYYPSGNKL